MRTDPHAERLIYDALELIRSLGIKASITSGSASITEPDPDAPGQKRRRTVGTRWRIHFTTTLPVFRLTRKAARLKRTVRSTRNWLYVTDVRHVETAPVRCISIDHPDRLFLAEGFVPTHNSSLVQSLFGWSLLERVSPSGKPGRPGRANTVIAIESKGEGAEGYRDWVEATGDEWALIEVADPASPVIDLFDVPRADGRPGPASAADRAEFFVNAMTYAFPAGDIQGRARETLTAVLTAALGDPSRRGGRRRLGPHRQPGRGGLRARRRARRRDRNPAGSRAR